MAPFEQDARRVLSTQRAPVIRPGWFLHRFALRHVTDHEQRSLSVAGTPEFRSLIASANRFRRRSRLEMAQAPFPAGADVRFWKVRSLTARKPSLA